MSSSSRNVSLSLPLRNLGRFDPFVLLPCKSRLLLLDMNILSDRRIAALQHALQRHAFRLFALLYQALSWISFHLIHQIFFYAKSYQVYSKSKKKIHLGIIFWSTTLPLPRYFTLSLEFWYLFIFARYHIAYIPHLLFRKQKITDYITFIFFNFLPIVF